MRTHGNRNIALRLKDAPARPLGGRLIPIGRRRPILALLLGATGALLAVAPARLLAAAYTWDGGASTTNWADGNNWNPNAPAGGPVSTDDVSMAITNSLTLSLNLGGNRSVQSFIVGQDISATSFTTTVSLSNASPASLTIGSGLSQADNTGTPITVGLIVGYRGNNAGTATGDNQSSVETGILTIGNNTTVTVNGDSYIGYRNEGNGNARGVGTTTVNTGGTLDLGSAGNLRLLKIGYNSLGGSYTNTGAAALGTLNGSGGTINAYLSTLAVGFNTRGVNSATGPDGQGVLDLSAIGSATINVGDNTTAGLVQIGYGFVSRGDVTMGSGVTLNVGTPSNLAIMRVGSIPGSGTESPLATGYGTFSGTGGSFTANLSELSIGAMPNEDNAGKAVTFLSGDSTVDLTNLTSATVTTNKLQIGFDNIGSSNTTTPTASLFLGNKTLDVTGSGALARVGFGDNRSATITDKTLSKAAVTMGAGSSVTLGDMTNRAIFDVGVNEDDVAGYVATGSWTATGGSFSADLTNLRVGVQAGTASGTVNGTLDLSAATMTHLSIQNDLLIGTATIGVATGTVKFSAITGGGSVGGNLTVGTTNVNRVGALTLDGSLLSVAGNAFVGTGTSKLTTDINGVSAGLSLASASTLTLSTAGDMAITFNDPNLNFTGIYYGLKWSGDHLASLLSLESSGDISITDNMASYNPATFYDSATNATYVGVMVVPAPEPTSVALLVAGVCLLSGWRRRGRTI